MKAKIGEFGNLMLIAETDEESLLIITKQFKRKFGEGIEFSSEITQTFAEKQRKNGYYWVKYKDKWIISWYSCFTWDAKSEYVVMDSDLEEIDESVITRNV